MITRVCSVCKIEQILIESFYRDNSSKNGKDGYERRCKICVKKRSKQYKIANSEKVKKYIKERYENNREKLIQIALDYNRSEIGKSNIAKRKNDPTAKEGIRLAQERYKQKNREKINEQARERYRNNPIIQEKAQQRSRKWENENPNKNVLCKRRYQHKRRERINNQRGIFTIKDWREICQKHDNLCAMCHKPEILTIDHVIPVSKGGLHDKENIQPLCFSCNAKKRSFDAEEVSLKRRFSHDYALMFPSTSSIEMLTIPAGA